MNDETRAYFEEMRRELTAIGGRFDAVDQRFDGLDGKIEAYRREARVIAEKLLDKIELVGEGVRGTVATVERLRADMEGRFNENASLMRAAFRQLRRDIHERRDRP